MGGVPVKITRALERRKKVLEEIMNSDMHDQEVIVIVNTELPMLTELLTKKQIAYEDMKKALLSDIGYGDWQAGVKGGLGLAWHEPISDHFDIAWLKYSRLVALSSVRDFEKAVGYSDIREVPNLPK